MSFTNSMNTAITGLRAQANAISTTSTNLANTSTTAYKASGTTFETLVSDRSTNGVITSVDHNNDAQGTIESSDIGTYMAISGSGYFAVKTATKNTDGSLTFGQTTYYTRDGDFQVNADGYLVNSEGYYLMGWSVDQSTGSPVKTLVPVEISNLTNSPVETSQIDYVANLSCSATGGTTTSASSVTVYDTQGGAHQVKYSWEKDSTLLNTWKLVIDAPDGAYDAVSGTSNPYHSEITVTFNDDGTMNAIDSTGTGYTYIDSTTFSFDLSYAGAATQSISCNLSKMTQYADKTQNISVSTFDQNGVPTGQFEDVTIDESGNVAVDYSNGQSVTYYEIPVATFLAPNNLEAIDGNAYSVTLASGDPDLNTAGTGGAGKISSKALEDSNVDIANEFTHMITEQQIYSANSKVISTVDGMYQTAVELKS
jgi:flagellar hook protein FlgE